MFQRSDEVENTTRERVFDKLAMPYAQKLTDHALLERAKTLCNLVGFRGASRRGGQFAVMELWHVYWSIVTRLHRCVICAATKTNEISVRSKGTMGRIAEFVASCALLRIASQER
ncbi:MAG TPA: hypothetical protein VFV47_04660 [Hyphomicrobiaceae bacterium]|nr:hypothetical protein [Hyphomicrobiaceae bacterium]